MRPVPYPGRGPFFTKTACLAAAALLFLCRADSALALDMEFYTYNGFGPVTQAFRKLALIFSDAGYVGLFFTATVLGILFAAMAFMIKMATGARIVPLVWAMPVLLGVVLYLGLFVPKGNITVYDPVLNRFDTIGGIPNGVVATAGILNKIERGLVEIIDTAGVPGARYQEAAGGIGFSTLKAAMNAGPKDAFARESMARYFQDCVMFEMVRPGTTFSADTMLYGTSDFLPELAKADNPAVFTVYYDAANPQGQTMTCREAWSNLFPIYNNATTFTDAVKTVCGASLYDPANAGEMTSCRNLISDTLARTTGAVVAPEHFIRQASLTRLIFQVLDHADPQSAMLVQTNRQVVSSGLGMAAAINEWLPVMRAIMTAVAIGLIPFLTLFLPTPLVGKALSVMAGFFVFLATWGISDAILHGAALDYAVEAFEDIRQSGLGLYACVTFPETSTKALAMFGIVRSSGIMLASFLSMMLIRFGGHALAMMAGSLQSAIQGAGARAGTLLTPEGKASALDQQVSTTVPLEMANHYGFSTQAASRQWQAHKGMQSTAADWQTLDAARDAGVIPAGMGNIEAAKSMFTANRSLGGGQGPVQLSTDPDGRLVFSSAQNMTGQGFVRQAQTGMDGAGVSTYTGGAGTLVTEGRNGEETVTSANVRNMDMNFARKQEERNLEKAAHSLASSENYSNMLSRLRQDSRTSTEARSFSEQLSNSEQEKWNKSVENGSAFSMVKDEKSRLALEASGAGGFNLGVVKAGGRYSLQGIGEDGEKLNISLSAKEAQAFEANRQQVRSEALTETLQNAQSLSYADNLSKSIGASEAHSYLSEAQRINTDSASYNNNMATAFIKDYAAYRYGMDSPENVQKAMTFLNSQAIGSRDDQRHLQELAKDFLSGRFGTLGTTGAGKTIEHDAHTVQTSQEHLRGEAHSAAETTLNKTGNINEQSQAGPPHGRVAVPNKHEVESKVEARQEFFEREQTGQGRVQTNVAGMIGEGIGKIDHAIGKIVGKPDRPQQDVMDIGAPDQPGAPLPGKVEAELPPVPATFEEALRKEQENKE
ncbi:MAG: conjugal transfer protein TraG N-terminal domain-containing protein [Proteobacteria bacterium]|nr:conjugal transfer protein TraG N-terminal domain-containing protein [Pseudomonadota bacterium]